MIIYKYIKLIIIKLNDFLQFLASALASILVGLMTLVILYMVFFRYVLNDTPYWSEEVARCMMLWMTFCILPVSYRLGSNVSLEIILKKLEGKNFRDFSNCDTFININFYYKFLLLFSKFCRNWNVCKSIFI